MQLKALYSLTYGLYVVSSAKEGKINGQIANTVFQVTSEPATIAVSINKNNLTHEFIKASKVFAISILSKEASMKFIGKFGFRSGRDIDKFKDVKYITASTGAPIVLEHCVSYLDVQVTNMLDVGTHTIFIGKIVDAKILDDTEPMTYAYYHKVKKGKAPKAAPTYIKKEGP